MSSFPSLPPPLCSPPREKTSSLLDKNALELKEKEHSLWIAELQQFPYSAPLGMKQADMEDVGMELEEDEVSLQDDSLEGSLGNEILVFEEDSDQMDSSSVQDVGALNESS